LLTATAVALDDEGDDRNYWRARSPQERMEALELMRQIIYSTATIRRPPDFEDFLRLLNSKKSSIW
jgi:hypothetical protein